MRNRLPLVIDAMSVLVVVGALIVALPTASGTPARSRPECTITGTNESDKLNGTTGPDVICAGGGNDQVFGRAGDDVLYLGPGDDFFNDAAGDDLVYGGPGSDFARVLRGDDRILLQGRRDMLLSWLPRRFHSGADLIVGGRGRDQLSVADGEGNDRLRGGPDRDSYCADAGDVIGSVETWDPLDCQEWAP
jgi:Ca2+-binding RTX toxin-like protein